MAYERNQSMEKVYVHKLKAAQYPKAPFLPSKVYPELQKMDISVDTKTENEIYDSVRLLLYKMGFDSENFGTENWNPMSALVNKGEKVLLKPNLVYHKHPVGEQEMLGMITNASILRPLIDYILLATEGEVNIKIGDAPVQGGDFNEACRISGMLELKQYYQDQGIQIELVDMRMVRGLPNKMGILAERIYQRGKDQYRVVDLEEKSELIDKIDKVKRFEITDYGIGSVGRHHGPKKNEYYIPKEVLDADLFINLPKLKTHRKAGITCAMKNLVGINGDKTCLAHHTRGTMENGGDEFDKGSFKIKCKVRIWTLLKTNRVGVFGASIIKWLFQQFVWGGQTMKRYNMAHRPAEFSEGSWYGNDTIWRCVKDLNKIIFYADKYGAMQETKQRKYLCFVDAVLAGEGEGPMEQTTKPFGVIMSGDNPVYIDYAASKLMKYNYKQIPCIFRGFENRWWKLTETEPQNIRIESNRPLSEVADYFIPTYGWQDKLCLYETTNKAEKL